MKRLTIFLIFAAINYNMFFYILIKRFRDIGKNEELRLYSGIVIVSTILIAINIFNASNLLYDSFGHALRDALFQVTSIISTAGFSTASFDVWPYFSQTILIILMFIGGSAGSTAGGLKVSRILILFKSMRREARKIFKPNSVKALRLDGDILSEATVRSTLSYFCFYILTMVLAFIVLSIEGKDLLTTSTTVISCFNNIGPALGDAFLTYADYSYLSKIFLSFVMLFGRLEIMPMLILFSPATWMKN